MTTYIRNQAVAIRPSRIYQELNSMDLKKVAVIGVLAVCMVVCHAHYKSSDFTDAGESRFNPEIDKVDIRQSMHTCY